jgi:nickel/cobalt transporter (NiCoT) family protein
VARGANGLEATPRRNLRYSHRLQHAVWAALLLSSAKYGLLLGLAPVAYGFGLRHAVDPDHIAAIDNTTRKLMQDGKRPVAVGFFFSLGHSTVVFASQSS